MCVLEIDLCGSTARSCAVRKCLLLLLCVLRAVRVMRVCCCFSRGLLDRVGRACCLVHVSFCGRVSSLSVVLCGLCMMVAVMEHKNGMWCGAAAACVLRFCVALRCENRNG